MMNIVNYLTVKGYTSKEIDSILEEYLKNGKYLPDVTSSMIREAIEEYEYNLQENIPYIDYE